VVEKIGPQTEKTKWERKESSARPSHPPRWFTSGLGILEYSAVADYPLDCALGVAPPPIMAASSGASVNFTSVRQKWPDIQIEHLILEASDFVVWIDKDLDIDWQTSEKYDETGPKDPAEWNQVLNRVAALECIPNDQHSRNVRLNFKRMIGEGVARGLDHDYESAKNILDQAGTYISDRNVEIARYWQLSTACIVGVVALLAAITMWLNRDVLTLELGEATFFLVLASIAGSVGAVLSMIFRMGHSYPTSEAPKHLHILEALSRAVAGCLSGVLIAGAIRVGLILPAFGSTGDSSALMLIAGMASGASERLAPSLITRLEGSSSKRPSKKGEKH
jgi:hypothetical protein